MYLLINKQYTKQIKLASAMHDPRRPPKGPSGAMRPWDSRGPSEAMHGTGKFCLSGIVDTALKNVRKYFTNMALILQGQKLTNFEALS